MQRKRLFGHVFFLHRESISFRYPHSLFQERRNRDATVAAANRFLLGRENMTDTNVVELPVQSVRKPYDVSGSEMKTRSLRIHISERHVSRPVVHRNLSEEDAAWDARFEKLQAAFRQQLYNR